MRRTRSEILGHAFRTTIRNPGRSTLTMLGLAIGVAAFIAMVSFGTGARTTVMEQFEILGTRVASISSNVGRRDFGGSPKPLTDADLEALRRDAVTVERVVPMTIEVQAVRSANATSSTEVFGTSPGFVKIREWPISTGGMFDDADVQQRAKVAVIGLTVARELFGLADPLGQTVTIGSNLPCTIIGVLASKGQATSGRDVDDILLVPATTFAAFLGMPMGYKGFELQVRDIGLLESAMEEVVPIMRRSHRLSETEPDDFRIGSPVQAAAAARLVSNILTGLLIGIAAVSLLVGGIGVMNIQLVSVAERTQEIGIRSAIGASPRQILLQFLSEAVVLSFTGSLAGVFVGWLMSSLVAEAMGWSESLSVLTMIGAAAFGTSVGVLFGYLPARRAAQLEPIEALRHE
ncbi:MAG: ABC transporter permease [Myxococcales bacterium]|nr:ABC transporter permease [Myxococcales bacterium]MDH3843844.1 ABC transporter permease [Myxococcales bacterium]